MRRLTVLLVALAVSVGAALPAMALKTVPVEDVPDHKIAICHRTEVSTTGALASPAHANQTGYVLIVISRNAWEQHHPDHESFKWGVTDVPATEFRGVFKCGRLDEDSGPGDE